jgi:hypothetical protein
MLPRLRGAFIGFVAGAVALSIALLIAGAALKLHGTLLAAGN